MTLRKVLPGEPLDVSAGTWNSFVDAAQDFKNRTANIGREAASSSASFGIISVKNTSTDDWEMFHVVLLTSPIFAKNEVTDKSLKNLLAFNAIKPDYRSSLEYGSAIVMEPIPAGRIGRAMVSGVSYVRVMAGGWDHYGTQARPSFEYPYKLDLAESGPYEVLWRDKADEYLETVQEVDAVVRIGHTFMDPTQVIFARIISNGSDGSVSAWGEVYPVKQTDGTFAWQSVSGGFSSYGEYPLLEANGKKDVPPGTIVLAGVAAWTTNGYVFSFTHSSSAQQFRALGFGKPAQGQTDVPPTKDLMLIVTDEGGTPILDRLGNQQQIKVLRNATQRELYTDFTSSTVFCYVVFAEPTPSGYVGCIYSRTEDYKFDNSYLPSGGSFNYPQVLLRVGSPGGGP